MEIKLAHLTLAALLATGFYCTHAAEASNLSNRAAIQSALSGLSLTEAVTQSASLVAAANETDRKAVASTVLTVMVRSHASVLPQVVTAISAKTPGLAGYVAAEAVRIHPDQAAEITKASVKAGSEQAAAIVESILFQNPSLYQVVGVSAMEAAPEKSRAILHSVSLTTLALKANIDAALAANPNPSAADGKLILLRGIKASTSPVRYQPLDLAGAQAAKKTADYGMVTPVVASTTSKEVYRDGAASSFLPPPTFTPLPVPLPTPPVESGVSQTQPEPPGGRDYSTP